MASKYRQLLNPEYTATTLSLIVTEMFTTQWMEWEPSVLLAELEQEVSGEVSSEVLDKLQAISMLHTTDLVYKSIDAFNPIARALASQIVAEGQYLPAELAHIVKAVAEINMHVGVPEQVNENIRKYVGILLTQAGLYQPPSILTWATYPENTKKLLEERVTPQTLELFWRDQKDTAHDYETVGLDHLVQMLTEIEALPLPIKKEQVRLIRETVQSARR